MLRAGRGLPLRLGKGATLRVVNTYGTQVVDLWAFAGFDAFEPMSMAHTRLYDTRTTPGVGTVFHTVLHRPVLAFTEDTSPGVHDWSLPACDTERYARLGHEGHHANCAENLSLALALEGLSLPYVPAPLNLFENVGMTGIAAPVSRPGDAVTLTAVAPCLVCLSACPQDMLPTNGPEMRPRDVELEVHAVP